MIYPAFMQKIIINIASQSLFAYDGDQLIFSYLVSTASAGPGEQKNSGCTPRGKHVIRAKIGVKAPINTVFVGRRPTGEIYSEALADTFPKRDWILSRIMWLSGVEVGKNRLGNQDTMQRYVYLHGTPDKEVMGKPGSHGCIRMRNNEIIELFDWAAVGCSVSIEE